MFYTSLLPVMMLPYQSIFPTEAWSSLSNSLEVLGVMLLFLMQLQVTESELNGNSISVSIFTL